MRFSKRTRKKRTCLYNYLGSQCGPMVSLWRPHSSFKGFDGSLQHKHKGECQGLCCGSLQSLKLSIEYLLFCWRLICWSCSWRSRFSRASRSSRCISRGGCWFDLLYTVWINIEAALLIIKRVAYIRSTIITPMTTTISRKTGEGLISYPCEPRLLPEARLGTCRARPGITEQDPG